MVEHRSEPSVNFAPLTPLRLDEHGQQHDGSSGRGKVGDADGLCFDVDAKLSELPAKLSRMRLAESNAVLAQEKN